MQAMHDGEKCLPAASHTVKHDELRAMSGGAGHSQPRVLPIKIAEANHGGVLPSLTGEKRFDDLAVHQVVAATERIKNGGFRVDSQSRKQSCADIRGGPRSADRIRCNRVGFSQDLSTADSAAGKQTE